MSSSTYKPWRYVAPGRTFGKVSDVVWHWPDSDPNERDQLAAVTQHYLSRACLEAMKSARTTRRAVADSQAWLTYDALCKVLRGELVMRPEHLGAFLHLGPQLPDQATLEGALREAAKVRAPVSGSTLPGAQAAAPGTSTSHAPGAPPAQFLHEFEQYARDFLDAARREHPQRRLPQELELDLRQLPGAVPDVDGFAGVDVVVMRGDLPVGIEIKTSSRRPGGRELRRPGPAGLAEIYVLTLRPPAEQGGDWEVALDRTD